MGHNRLPRLPASRDWREVVGLLEEQAPAADVIAQAAIAAQRSFSQAVDDPVYAEAVRLLVAISQASLGGAFTPDLSRNALILTSDATLFDLLDAVGRRLDQMAHSARGTSDIGELARRSILGTLQQEFGARLPGLFDQQPGDLALAARDLSGPAGFSRLSRAFFTRMTSETLSYFLDRTLSAQLGAGKGFDDIAQRDAFDAALTQFSFEATRIIREFSAGWFARHALSSRQTPDAATRGYAAIAFKKINDELSRKVGTDA